MRANRISLIVLAAAMMGSTPVSSLDTPRKFARGELVVCAKPDTAAISLLGASGTFGIALISPRRCN
jgi:hypothetical protein